MARRRSDKALGRDPLDALEDIEWIVREETVDDSRADVAPERAVAEAEPSADAVAAEIESAPGQPGTQSGMQPVEGTTDAADRAHPAGWAVEPAPGAGESQVTQPTEKPTLASITDEGDAEDDQEDSTAVAEPDGDAEDDQEDGTAVAEPDGEVCHLLDELIAAIDRDVEQALQPGAVADPAAAALARPEDEEQYVIFTLAGAEYAAPITNVIEIGRPLSVTPVPNVPDWVVGVANLRGDIISMVDLRAFLGMERIGYGHASRMLVAQAHQGHLTTGLIVDRVSGIWYLPVDQIGAPAAPIEDQVTPYLRGVYELDGRLLVVLDLDRLLLSPEMRQFEPV